MIRALVLALTFSMLHPVARAESPSACEDHATFCEDFSRVGLHLKNSFARIDEYLNHSRFASINYARHCSRMAVEALVLLQSRPQITELHATTFDDLLKTFESIVSNKDFTADEINSTLILARSQFDSVAEGLGCLTLSAMNDVFKNVEECRTFYKRYYFDADSYCIHEDVFCTVVTKKCAFDPKSERQYHCKWKR